MARSSPVVHQPTLKIGGFLGFYIWYLTIECRYGGSNPFCAREDGGLSGLQGEGDLKRSAWWKVLRAIYYLVTRCVAAISILDNYWEEAGYIGRVVPWLFYCNSGELCHQLVVARYRASSVTTGMAVEGPLMARTESRDQYESARSKGGSASPNSTISSISCSSVSSCGSTGSPTSSRPPDPRFSAGSSTRSTYRDVSAHTEEARQRAVVPASNLRMEGDFHRSVSSRDHFRNAGLYSRYPSTVIQHTLTIRQHPVIKHKSK